MAVQVVRSRIFSVVASRSLGSIGSFCQRRCGSGRFPVRGSMASSSLVQAETTVGNSNMAGADDAIKFSEEPTFETLRTKMSEFAKERDWEQYHTPRNLLLAMVGEVGELAELFQWREKVEVGLPDWTEAEKTHLQQELGDVLLYLIRIADRCHVDLPAAALNKLELSAKKYPASLVRGSSRKYTEYQNKPSSAPAATE